MMVLFNIRDQGGVLETGLNFTVDKNAYFNITLKVPSGMTFYQESYDSWQTQCIYSDVWLRNYYYFRVRLRRWGFVKSWPEISTLKRIGKMFLFGFAKHDEVERFSGMKPMEELSYGE